MVRPSDRTGEDLVRPRFVPESMGFGKAQLWTEIYPLKSTPRRPSVAARMSLSDLGKCFGYARWIVRVCDVMF